MADNANGDAVQNGNGKSAVDIATEIEEQDKKEREERRKQREPPIVFPNLVNVSWSMKPNLSTFFLIIQFTSENTSFS